MNLQTDCGNKSRVGLNAGERTHRVLLESVSELLETDFNNILTTNLHTAVAIVD